MKNYIKLLIFIFTFILFFNCNNKIFAQLSAPELLFPPDNSIEVPLAFLFEWDNVIDATSYRIQITEDNSFNNLVCDESNLDNNYFEVSEYIIDFSTTYYWRVQASNENFTSEWSGIWSFTTYEYVSSYFVWLLSPSNNSFYVPTTALFTWFEAFGSNVNYHIQISTDSLFNNVDIDEITTETQFEANNLNFDTKYFWRVMAYNESFYTYWSKIRSFTTVSDSISNFNIPLINGWNLISSYIVPTEPAMENVFSGISNIVLVKNGAGQIYSPAFGINQIGNWNIGAGYYVYTNGSSILNISGNEVNPALQGIQLNPGWYLISYLRNSPMNVQQALAGISSHLKMAKNNSGGIYHPGFGINTIGEMQPGQGYWLYITAPTILNYPGN